MQDVISESIVKIQPRGVLTIPKKLRESVGLGKESLVRVKREKGRLVIEPVRTLPYPVRSYTDEEIEEFLEIDAKETKELKAKGLL